MLINGHEACFVCKDNFCFSAVENCEQGVEAGMVFSHDHEGWQGIPHGGVAMTALLDLADHCWLQIKGENLVYPLEIDWRFADTVSIGDEMSLKAVVKDENSLLLSMRRQGSEKIYLSAEVRVATEAAGVDFPLLEPEMLLEHSAQHQALAVYDNCFVCGLKRQKPGLRRRFFRVVDNLPSIIVRFGGCEIEDFQLASSFQQASGILHPGVLAALLDELCGWSGILAGDLYGFTVRFKLHLNRLPDLGEELFGVAPVPLVRGRGTRKFYHPKGALYQKKADGSLEVIAVATGQWLAREELRQQFDESHIEEDMSGIVF
ncbi:MAG: hypothetical protein J7L57_05925 [Deltaproteobacteria bacterium]|nr:hypothetical protein [Candidatus Tharpella sp.]